MMGLAVSSATVLANHRPILDDVSVDFATGLVTAVIGPNGAGKSTLLAVAAGVVRPLSGRVLLGGIPIRRLPVKVAARRRAVMPQDTTVAFPFTVTEVVSMGRVPWGDSAAATAAVVDECLDLVGLSELRDREIATLSGGERQLTALARIITQATPVSEGSVLLLDEPTSAMDIAHAETTLRLARSLAAEGAAVGIVLHDLDAAAAYADRLVLMDHGRIHSAGSVSQVCDPATLSSVYGTQIEVFHHGDRLHVAPARTPEPAIAHRPGWRGSGTGKV